MTTNLDDPRPCPCNKVRPYRDCCEPFHQGNPAPTPEILMRSRFTAFVLGLSDYLLATWHPDSRPVELDLEGTPEWTSLQILDSGEQEDQGRVHFRAIYRAGNGWGYLEEASEFRRQDSRWYYLRGDTSEGVLKPGRNEACPCGSGRKYKACCR